jgi:hypothetical protein
MNTIDQALQNLGDQIVAEMQQTLSNKGISASGNLSRSITATVIQDKNNVSVLEVSMLSYGEIVDAGRGKSKTGGPKQTWRPEIKEWIKQKGISLKPGVTLDQAAFLITRKINQRGYPAKPFIDSSIDKVLANNQDAIAEAAFQLTINKVDNLLR